MRFLLSLAVIGAVLAVWVAVCVRLGAWEAERAARREARAERMVAPRRAVRLPSPRSRLVLPAGHQPPPGLGPLSPSERFLTQEAERGLRDLQLFLVDQQAA